MTKKMKRKDKMQEKRKAKRNLVSKDLLTNDLYKAKVQTDRKKRSKAGYSKHKDTKFDVKE